jgi:hypothetical protein
MEINISNLNNVNLNGRGGKEIEFSKLFNPKDGWKRKSHKLYDYENTITGEKIELKKQKQMQWFDPAKYANLTDEEKSIIMLFCLVSDTGCVDKMFSISLGDFIKINWSEKILNDSAAYKSQNPDFQIKAPLDIKKFYLTNKKSIKVIYDCSDANSKHQIKEG